MNKELTDRQKRILSIIVDAYVESSEPVGSRTIARKYHLDISPATIRNEMSDLEEAGLITHPHTSAGRIPTDGGYRYFIDHLIERQMLSPEMAVNISRQLKHEIEWIDGLIEKVSCLLAGITKQAGIVSYPEMKSLVFRRLDLQPLDETHVWTVWTTTTGFSTTILVDMKSPVTDEEIRKIGNFFNEELSGCQFSDIPAEIRKRLASRRDSLFQLYELAVRMGEEAVRKIGVARLCVEGSSHILEKPDFQDISKTTSIFRTLENRRELLELMKEGFDSDGVRVHIGRENKREEIWECSLITSSYKVHGNTVGVLGILGPKRMLYSNLISYVDFISKEISRALEQWI
ncbi:MAG TPA: heat-inducible transcriptional repressor HrcA [Candidatus Omnitrophota bacterium]|nr:heat-inducible transcriptional repressor HrcA [Candidatus Omnitrophota bacterium]